MIIHVNAVDKTNSAVARPEEALKLLRKASGEKKMVLHSGVYYGTELTLTPEDNGLIIEGDGQGRAVLSGGIPVDNWQLDTKTGWFYTQVPLKDGKPVDFRLLLSGKGDYLKKARYPLDGELKHLSVFDSMGWKGSCFGGWGRELRRDELDNFIYDPKDFTEEFVFENAEVQVYHSWNESYTCVVGMDRQTNTFYVDPPCGHPVGSFWHNEYVVYNTAEGMAEDGRWYHDKKNHLIYYRPFPGETAETFCAIVPMTTKVISLAEGCKDITIRGIDVTAATTPVVTDIFSTKVMRGAGGFVSSEQDAAIHGEGLAGILIEDVAVYKTGGLGIKLKGDDIYVRNAKISQCGAGGIMLSINDTIPEKPSEEIIATWPRVEGCHIDNIGIDYYSGVAIFANNAIVSGNYVENTPYSGIVLYGDNVVVEKNVVIDPMQRLNDGAGIYKLLDKNGIIRNNFVQRRKGSDSLNCKGLYLDAPGEGFVVTGNVVKGFSRVLHHHIGQPGTFWENNYFENDGNILISLHRTQGAHIVNNIFKCSGRMCVQAPEGAIVEFRGNVMRHGGDWVAYEEGNGNSSAKPACPLDVDSTNNIERVLL